MSGVLALLRYDLRRHLPWLVAAGCTVVALPLVHRAISGHWQYWADGSAESGALFVAAFLAPLLALVLPLRTWAAERADGTLLWLYAQPLSSGALFGARVAAVAVAILVFLAGGLAFNATSPASLLPWLWPALALIAFCAAASLCANAVAANLGRAARGLLVGGAVVVLGGVGPWLLPWEGHVWSHPALLDLLALQSLLWSVGLLLGAWGAVRRAPVDLSRGFRALLLTLAPLALGMLPSAIPWLVSPIRFGSVEVVLNRDMGGGSRIELVRSTAMHPMLTTVRVVPAGGPAVTLPLIAPMAGPVHALTTRLYDPMVSPVAGRAVLPTAAMGCRLPRGEIEGLRWSLIDRQGRMRSNFLPFELDSINLLVVGWSPGGTRFAWLDPSRTHLVLLDGRLATRRIGLPKGGPWDAHWLDERRLQLTPDRHSAGAQTQQVIDVGTP